MRLVYDAGVEFRRGGVLTKSDAKTEVCIGDGVKTAGPHGEWFTVRGIVQPHKPESTGRMMVWSPSGGFEHSYFPSVFNCEWIEREDRDTE